MKQAAGMPPEQAPENRRNIDRLVSRLFEMRRFTPDKGANGQTDFKGDDEWMDTQERIDFLNDFATCGKNFYQVPNLDQKPVSDEEAAAILRKVKPQPQPEVRKRINLTSCKWIGYRDGLSDQRKESMARWQLDGRAEIADGRLVFKKEGAAVLPLEQESSRYYGWRYHLSWDVEAGATESKAAFALKNGNISVIEAGISPGGRCYYVSGGKRAETEVTVKPGETSHFKLEVDHESGKYNLLIDEAVVADFVGLNSTEAPDRLCIKACNGTAIDNMLGVGFANKVTREDLPGVNSITSHLDPGMFPFLIRTFIDEPFQLPVTPDDWADPDHGDALWNDGVLPLALGGERHEGQSLYIRHRVTTGDFEKATLNIESMFPGGEIWVNGRIVELCKNDNPRSIDLSRHLARNADNVVAFRISPYKLALKDYMTHSITDQNIGWFLGRAHIDLHHSLAVSDLFVHTLSIDENSAKVRWQAVLNNAGATGHSSGNALEGQLRISLTPWFPEESSEAAVVQTREFLMPWKQQKTISGDIEVPSPALWSHQTPHLYKVKVELVLKDGTVIDDYATTMGIRTVSQEGGTFRINGRPEMLNGALLFGFREPIGNLVRDLFCPRGEDIVKDMMRIRRVNGNSIRMSVHAGYYGGSNDPRYAEIADQLGVMLIWTTSEFIRERSPWTVRCDQLQEDIKLVRNHPSIVIWQPGNHVWYANAETALDWYDQVFETILPVDPSRLVNPCALQHDNLLMRLNNEGTKMVEKDGESWIDMKPRKSWTSPLHAGGTMLSAVGYGEDWSTLSTIEQAYRGRSGYGWEQLLKERLNHPCQAFVNYETQECIGQPNWNLVRGQPWYRVQSYEHGYDKGSIGRRLEADEWQTSQAWQAFAGYELSKKMRLLDFDGMHWCPLRGGGNTATYKKPLLDYPGHAKLSYYVYGSILQRTVAASDDVDVVYGPDDEIRPVIFNLGPQRTVNLTVNIRRPDGPVVFTKTYEDVELQEGRTRKHLPGFTPELSRGDNIAFSGNCAVEYVLQEAR